MKNVFLSLKWVLAGTLSLSVALAETVFSGPQKGETLTPFRVVPLHTGSESEERDPITELDGAPTVFVFLHALERSLVPLLKVIEAYGTEQKDRLKSEVVFLFEDRLQGEQRGRAATQALQLRSQSGLSVDGAEGPGNYGLNKECMMTILVAKDNQVQANFALVQPGIADAEKVLAALADVVGDANPPTVQALMASQNSRPDPRMARPGESAPRETPGRAGPQTGEDGFPGAVPTDPQLASMLRTFIQPNNDEIAVQRVLRQVRQYVQDNPERQRQARDGWLRMLHFGDRYGTAYAREQGQLLLDELEAQLQE